MTEINGEDKLLMQALRDDGFTLAEIAEKFECSKTLVASCTVKRKSISASKLRMLIEDGDIPSEPVGIAIGRKLIGTFTPINSAH